MVTQLSNQYPWNMFARKYAWHQPGQDEEKERNDISITPDTMHQFIFFVSCLVMYLSLSLVIFFGYSMYFCQFNSLYAVSCVFMFSHMVAFLTWSLNFQLHAEDFTCGTAQLSVIRLVTFFRRQGLTITTIQVLAHCKKNILYYTNNTWGLMLPKLPPTRLFVQDINNESIGDPWFPAQRATNTESVSISRHHVTETNEDSCSYMITVHIYCCRIDWGLQVLAITK